jgi:hypothetical protein
MNGRREGKPLQPNTAYDPLLQQIFAEQERLNVSTRILSHLSGVPQSTIEDLRHPSSSNGKRIMLHHIRRLCEALDFDFPLTIKKRA